MFCYRRCMALNVNRLFREQSDDNCVTAFSNFTSTLFQKGAFFLSESNRYSIYVVRTITFGDRTKQGFHFVINCLQPHLSRQNSRPCDSIKAHNRTYCDFDSYTYLYYISQIVELYPMNLQRN